MLLCGCCHAKRSPCQGGHSVVAFGRCDACGRSDDRVACRMTPAQAQRVQIAIYRSTHAVQYPSLRKG